MIRKMEIVFNRNLSSSATSHKPAKETASKLPSLDGRAGEGDDRH
jgi:hypothetical protein